MTARASRTTVDLSSYPDLVVVYLGMRVQSPRGLLTLFHFGPQISASVAAQPDGLLLHESLTFSLFPLHVGMRQYWRDFGSLERWVRELPHKDWWTRFLRDPGGTGFWHEAYFMQGGMEAIYVGMPTTTGLGRFADKTEARGSMFSARRRAARTGQEIASPLSEEELYKTGPH